MSSGDCTVRSEDLAFSMYIAPGPASGGRRIMRLPGNMFHGRLDLDVHPSTGVMPDGTLAAVYALDTADSGRGFVASGRPPTLPGSPFVVARD